MATDFTSTTNPFDPFWDYVLHDEEDNEGDIGDYVYTVAHESFDSDSAVKTGQRSNGSRSGRRRSNQRWEEENAGSGYRGFFKEEATVQSKPERKPKRTHGSRRTKSKEDAREDENSSTWTAFDGDNTVSRSSFMADRSIRNNKREKQVVEDIREGVEVEVSDWGFFPSTTDNATKGDSSMEAPRSQVMDSQRSQVDGAVDPVDWDDFINNYHHNGFVADQQQDGEASSGRHCFLDVRNISKKKSAVKDDEIQNGHVSTTSTRKRRGLFKRKNKSGEEESEQEDEAAEHNDDDENPIVVIFETPSAKNESKTNKQKESSSRTSSKVSSTSSRALSTSSSGTNRVSFADEGQETTMDEKKRQHSNHVSPISVINEVDRIDNDSQATSHLYGEETDEEIERAPNRGTIALNPFGFWSYYFGEEDESSLYSTQDDSTTVLSESTVLASEDDDESCGDDRSIEEVHHSRPRQRAPSKASRKQEQADSQAVVSTVHETNSSIQSVPKSVSPYNPREVRSALKQAPGTPLKPSFDEVSQAKSASSAKRSPLAVEELHHQSVLDQAQRNKSLLGRVACRSVAHDQDEPLSGTSYPDVRLVADIGGPQKVITAKSEGDEDALGAAAFPLTAITTRKGPQSFYSYEYETGCHMDVSYDHFGKNPVGLLQVRKHPKLPSPKDSSHCVCVKIEASTISPTDCRIRRGEWTNDTRAAPLPGVPGVDFVGKVHSIDKRISKRFNIKSGDRVMSLVWTGGNSRYTHIAPDQLLEVPENVDTAEATCLAETYLAAFQVIHFGQRGRSRFRQRSLTGKSILVIGALSNMGRAIVELAYDADSTFVHAICKDKQRKAVRDLGATPLRPNMDDWLPLLHGNIDLIINVTGEYTSNITLLLKTLNDEGQYIFLGESSESVEHIVDKSLEPSRLSCSKNRAQLTDRIHSYNVFELWLSDTEGSKRDLKHLLMLLEKGHLQPNILDRLPLFKVARAHEVLESKRIGGFLVCEPWIKEVHRTVCL